MLKSSTVAIAKAIGFQKAYGHKEKDVIEAVNTNAKMIGRLADKCNKFINLKTSVSVDMLEGSLNKGFQEVITEGRDGLKGILRELAKLSECEPAKDTV